MSSKASMRRVVAAGMVGNALEWYDFALYGQFAWLLSQHFFPSENQLVALMATYGAFAAGFAMRPIGAVLFGYLGDRYGRKRSLALAILLMAVPTACIGLLPTYAQIGVMAPLLLTLIRLLQGLSLGGEFSGSITFMVEHSEAKKRGFIGSASMVSLVIGMLMGSLAATVTSHILSPEDLAEWGWRVPFLFGIVIGFVGFYIRHYTEESPKYTEAKEAGHLAEAPFREAVRDHWFPILEGVVAYLTVTVPFYIFSIFMISFISKILGYPSSFALLLNTAGMAMALMFIAPSAWLSDRIGRKPILVGGALAYLLLSYPLFLGITSGNELWMWISILTFGMLLGIYIGPMPAVLVELFPTRVRFTGMAISYNLSATLFGGTAPFVCTWLIDRTGMTSVVAFYPMLCAALTLLMLTRFKDRAGQEIH